MKDTKFIIKLAAILFLITFICTLLLVLCNTLTKDRIAKLQLEAENSAKAEVFPGAESFENIQADGVSAAYVCKDSNGNTAGYCFKTETSGFGGPISVIVGVDINCQITGVKIIDMSETPGLGAKASESDWLSQFRDKTDSISVVKTGNAKDNEINAISGATITSKAVTNGVNLALDAAKEILEKEGR